MTAYYLQEDLREEIKKIFNGFLLKTPKLDQENKAILSQLNVYDQSLPLQESDEEEPFPYVIVKLDQGNMKEGSAHLVKVRLIIGVYDDDTNANGHKDVLNIIQKIYERFVVNPVLNGRYHMKDDNEFPFLWALPDDDTNPYYFGVVEMTWEVAAMRRESEFT